MRCTVCDNLLPVWNHATTCGETCKWQEPYKDSLPATKGLTDALNALGTFKSRADYMNAHYKRLGRGTGRAVYAIADNLVLKLAHCGKGLAQNAVETDFCMRSNYGHILAPWLVADNEDRWIISARVERKASTKDFREQWASIPLGQIFDHIRACTDASWAAKVPLLDDHEIVNDIIALCVEYDMCSGDVCYKNAWGILRGKLVLMDYGLSWNTWRQLYVRGR